MKFLLLLAFFYTSVYANALAQESSPYLQQHKSNPVDWYPWGEEALVKAKKEDKLIFLSIGYSTCHWCHVMAHESFENKKISKLFNKDYISIKVDREELPHLDKLYQNLHSIVKNRSGGWPLTVILTPELKPIFVGTYIPPIKKYRLEGLKSLLPRLAFEYKTNRQKMLKEANVLARKLSAFDENTLKTVKIDLEITTKVFADLEEQFDDIYYGFSYQPKFPESSKIALLFDLDALGVKGAKKMALLTLSAMALHGLYDQVEGGFFRYSVDAAWEIPHFEKMLYTNAELIPLYVKAYELTHDELYINVVVETIQMIENRFESKGLYYSASDADSAYEEGGFFTYSYDEVLRSMSSLNTQEKKALVKDLELIKVGNFEDKTHINFFSNNRPKSFLKVRANLQKIRQSRQYPFIDKKINTAWNAMMIEALFIASQLDEKYLALAEKRVNALLDKMYVKGVLYHQVMGTKALKQKALLEDYAFLVSALLSGYEKTYKKQYLNLAERFSDEAIEKFYKQQWYLSNDGLNVHADMLDKYYTAAMNKMLMGLLKLANLKGDRRYLDVVKESLLANSSLLKKDPVSKASLMRVFLREKKGL